MKTAAKIIIGTGCALIAAAGLASWQVRNALNGPIVIAVDYDSQIADVFRKNQPNGPDGTHSLSIDGWDEILALSTEFDQLAKEVVDTHAVGMDKVKFSCLAFDVGRYSDVRHTPAETEALEYFFKLADERGLFRRLDATSLVWRSRDAMPSSGSANKRLINGASARIMMRVNLGRLGRAVAVQDWHEAPRAFESGLTIGRHLINHGERLERVLGNVAFNMNLERLNELSINLPDDTTLRMFEEALNRQLRFMPISAHIQAAKLEHMKLVQAMYSDLGEGRGYISGKRLQAVASRYYFEGTYPLTLAEFRVQDRREVVVASKKYFDQVALCAAQSDGERIRCALTLDDAIPSSEREVFLDITLPRFGHILRGSLQLEMQSLASRTILAIERFRRKSGHAPQTLGELVPEFLAAVPHDPISGSELGYIKSVTSSGHAPYTLYSLGLDGIDNRGVEHPYSPSEQDARFFAISSPERGYGFDFVLNPPPPQYEPASPPDR